MKNYIYSKSYLLLFYILLGTFHACDKENLPQNDSLIGRWQLIERYDGGSPQPVQSVIDGKTVTFKTDKSLLDSFLPECPGTFSNDNSIITIDFDCRDDLVKYSYRFEDEMLFFNSFPSTCIEGCYDKYKRIK